MEDFSSTKSKSLCRKARFQSLKSPCLCLNNHRVVTPMIDEDDLETEYDDWDDEEWEEEEWGDEWEEEDDW